MYTDSHSRSRRASLPIWPRPRRERRGGGSCRRDRRCDDQQQRHVRREPSDRNGLRQCVGSPRRAFEIRKISGKERMPPVSIVALTERIAKLEPLIESLPPA